MSSTKQQGQSQLGGWRGNSEEKTKITLERDRIEVIQGEDVNDDSKPHSHIVSMGDEGLRYFRDEEGTVHYDDLHGIGVKYSSDGTEDPRTDEDFRAMYEGTEINPPETPEDFAKDDNSYKMDNTEIFAPETPEDFSEKSKTDMQNESLEAEDADTSHDASDTSRV